MIGQFDHQFSSPNFWINKHEVRQHLLGKKDSVEQQKANCDVYRLVFRRQAASTNERTLISTIIYPAIHADNLASVAAIDKNGIPIIDNSSLLFLCAIFNSLTLDYCIRQRITTNLNFFYIYQLPIPRLASNEPFFADIVTRAAKLICTTDEFANLWNEVMAGTHPQPLPGGEKWTPECGVTDEAERNRLRAELDGMIANIYGLTYEEFEYILSTFPLVPQAQKDATLEMFREFHSRNNETQHWKALIAQGESNTLEFKSTLRYCLKQNSPQKYVEHAVMKTIAAYLNSEGGTLLIGVDDSGAILGLEHDFSTFKKPDKVDEFLKHVDNLIAANFGDHVHHYLDIKMLEVEGKTLCAVAVKEKASDAVWLMNKEKNAEQFYIRRSASTIELPPSEAMKYIRNHWK